MQSELELLSDAFPDRPEMGPALSRVLLEQVARGERGPTVRLSRPGRVVAFGRRDLNSPGYAEAVAAAREAGFAAMERIAGGRAAAYSEGTLSLTITLPDQAPARRTSARFEYAAGIARDALRELGVDARIGEVEGEYCPGAFSVSSGGRTKLVGIGQRMVRGAAHIGFVIAVSDSSLIRQVLEPVYSALDLEWNPGTVGAIDDQLPAVGLAETEEALLTMIRSDSTLNPAVLDPSTVERAEAAAPGFRSPG
jgi:lipoate-protein ligase A